MDGEREEITAESHRPAPDASDPYEIAQEDIAEEGPAARPGADPQSARDAIAAARGALRKNRREDEQFSLSGLLVLITVFSLICAPLAWVRLEIFAGIAGGAALLMMCVISVWPGRRIIVDVAWWCLLGVYLMVCGMLCLRAW